MEKLKLVRKDQKRRRIRFKGNPETVAQIDFVPESEAFASGCVALVSDESFSGCGLVVINGQEFNVGQQLAVKVGNLGPVQARVQWIVEVDHQVSRIGIKYL